ncbi:hypothetical protein KIN20_029413 [Parelaphostrongylus tenuis]|uniref:Uncharacterized protein n=1 Tax=Parelaphostrongylus tenuis TaxID=148309 RepID=A0AAD5R2I6_PARTN|nr:hypothetical protein KIN20_029413 [Parelaphostrongylus tenuis]
MVYSKSGTAADVAGMSRSADGAKAFVMRIVMESTERMKQTCVVFGNTVTALCNADRCMLSGGAAGMMLEAIPSHTTHFQELFRPPTSSWLTGREICGKAW